MCLQRQTRLINDLFNIFFSAECQKLYKPLLKLRVIPETRQIERLEKISEEQKLSVALGQVVQLCIHFSRALNIVLRNQMTFDGYRSYIHSRQCIDDGS